MQKMPVAKYRSRRKQLKRHRAGKKGGGISIPKIIHDVHTSAHHPEDLVKVLQSAPESAHIAHKLLREHANVAHAIKHKIARFPRWKARVPDRSIDLHAMAKTIFKKHNYRSLPKLGGSVNKLEYAVNVAKQIHDPITEGQAAKSSYDKVDFHDRSARGWAKNATTGLAGNFHVASTHMKTGMTFIPGLAGFLEGGAQGFSGVGYGLDKVNSMI
jgi:hypothetical protein